MSSSSSSEADAVPNDPAIECSHEATLNCAQAAAAFEVHQVSVKASNDVQICNCTRSFGASLVQGTNLLLVVAESDAYCDETDCELQEDEMPLQEPQEDSGPSLGDRICAQQSKPRHRNLLKGQCISRHPAEDKMNFPCGSAFGLLPSILLIFSSLLFVSLTNSANL